MSRPSTQGVNHPVFPYRTGGKLLFPLCRTCADESLPDPHYRCPHDEAQRCFMGTWVTTELHKALDCGYRLDKIYEVWNFPRQSVDLFRRYIDIFLKIKQETSGFPPQCQTEEQKQSYIEDIFRRQKILLDSINIEKEDHSKIIFELLMGKIRSASTIAKDSIPYGTRGIRQTLGRQYHFIERDGTLE